MGMAEGGIFSILSSLGVSWIRSVNVGLLLLQIGERLGADFFFAEAIAEL